MYRVLMQYTETSSSSATVGELDLYNPRCFEEGYMITDATVTYESNSAGSFTFTMPPTNPRYNDLVKLKTIIKVYELTGEKFTNSELIWKGRVLEEEIDFELNKKVTCEGEMAFLNDVFTFPYDYNDDDANDDNTMTISDFIKTILTEYNARCTEERQIEMGDVIIFDADEDDDATSYSKYSYSNTEYSDCYSELTSQITDVYGGYFEVANGKLNYYSDYSGSLLVKNGYSSTKWGNAKLPSSFFANDGTINLPEGWTETIDDDGDIEYTYENISTQTINFGENLVDITQTLTVDELCTCLIPLGAEESEFSGTAKSARNFLKGRMSISTNSEESTESNGDYMYYEISDSSASAKYCGDGDIVKSSLAKSSILSSNRGYSLLSKSGVAKYGMIYKVVTYDEVKNVPKLLRYGCRDLYNALNQTYTIELSAVDLHLLNVDTERLKINQYIRVISQPHNIDEYFVCTKIELNLSDPGETTYTFGDSIKGITD